MEKVFSFLENRFEISNLASLPWKTVVDDYILAGLAKRPHQRTRISSEFMSFMARFGDKCYQQDRQLGVILYEVALQRISDGAVLHRLHPTPTFDALPKEYADYASCNGYVGCEPGLMGCREYDFIITRLADCADILELRKHAMAIAWGLTQYISFMGETRNSYMLGNQTVREAEQLHKLGCRIIEKYATSEEKIRNWLTPQLWREHQEWFVSELKNKVISWDEFFEKTKADGCGSKLTRWFRRREIKKRLMC